MNVLSIRNDVAGLLDDAGNDIWSATDIESWIFDGELQIATLRPDSTATTDVVTLVAGTLQTIPDDGLRFIDLPRNIAADDSVGMAITDIARADLDRYFPDWHMQTEAAEVEHYMFDTRSPREFYVSPPVIDGTKASACYSLAPVAYGTVDESTETTVKGNYRPALIEWALHRARTVDIKANRGVDRAQHLNSFYQMLGFKGSSDKGIAPDPVSRD